MDWIQDQHADLGHSNAVLTTPATILSASRLHRTNRNRRPPRNEFFRCQVEPLRSNKEVKANQLVLSLFNRRFPELDAVAFGVHDPAEVTELGLFRLIDIDTFASKLSEQRIEIMDTVVDHERLFARFEIIG